MQLKKMFPCVVLKLFSRFSSQSKILTLPKMLRQRPLTMLRHKPLETLRRARFSRRLDGGVAPGLLLGSLAVRSSLLGSLRKHLLINLRDLEHLMLHAVRLQTQTLKGRLRSPHEGPVVCLQAHKAGGGVDPGGPHLPQRGPLHRDNLAGVLQRGLSSKEGVVRGLDGELLLVHVVQHKRLPRVERPLLRHVALRDRPGGAEVCAVRRPEDRGAVLGVLDGPLLPVVDALLLVDAELCVEVGRDVVAVVPPDRHPAVGVLLDGPELVGEALSRHHEAIAGVPVDGEVSAVGGLEGELLADALHLPLLPELGVVGECDLAAVGRRD
mmetsp:Transcript_14608/g.28861  ORF Transcript_14608/g.28861 Transcript_14608/m.28861 type:complete len:325 (+) Transcript_14608:267-1241(+)